MQATMMLSNNGRYLVKIIPGRWVQEKRRITLKRSPYLLAFKILKNGQLEQVWSMKSESEHGARMFISNDGQSLVTLQNPKQYEDSVLTLFRNGKKMRSYAARAFGIQENHLQILPCDGRHRWVHGKRGSVHYSRGALIIRTVTGSLYKLDMKTGVLTPHN
ncbi:MAG: hypothetical protein CSB47_01130 [Proteobacteria bacterium]|nr:MAG: hypothetical protein CSB47_01130 [Pseudomonadota bacterium]